MTSTTVVPTTDLLRERAAHYAAQAALFLRDQALSTASHDLRSPLNAMQSWAYVLERQLAGADPNLQRALAGIRTGIEQQVTLIDGVLDAPREESRTPAIVRQPFALRAVLDDTVALVRFALADARHVAIDAALPDGDPVLSADRERVAQALWTMLTTAVEASAAGSRVTLACTRDGARIVARATCCVQAAALADPTLPHAFESFARREMLRERDAKRVAWTLALCQRVAIAHGGTFVHDAFTDGATVALTLALPGDASV
ncbi:HAMP domain-containing histidine kinase [Burkholderia dolosa]|uniref:histidine kinase n=1 Tax=Burkholderia dolosa TaxID=152500 RepID=A0A892IEF9_9BURK|nr:MULTISPECIES: HAMP domain-containing sensor histidine kinase [Burkholderia]AKE05448.1 histidine kinase [Burkholderia cepacia]AJY09582.1 his Kinase A domain protein [Burkholderia dolosa AU0158]AYZ94233.1 sensor histidine kinase [Burkholderia dolosa]EAY70063.1 Signal transduction histidine kinase [Burkholderia dolosa AU0158]ETP62024.1 histidine kinase [Burkholderia dolosa PC543]